VHKVGRYERRTSRSATRSIDQGQSVAQVKAVAPEAVLTVRTYGTGPLHDPGLVRKSAQPKHANQHVNAPSQP
jgi:hypothetical protein